MKRLSAALALALSVLVVAPALAATSFVQDGAGMFDASTIAQLDSRLSNFNAQTGKEVLVVTVPSLPAGETVDQAAQAAAAQQHLSGVLIYIARDDHKIYVLPDAAATRAGWFTAATSTSIAHAIGAQFKAGDYDGGITTGVSQVLDIYRSHLGSLPGANGAYAPQRYAPSGSYAANGSPGGVHFNVFWIVILAVVGYLVLRSIMRASMGPRGYGGPVGPPGAPGGPGYGPGYGGYGPGYYGGGGGSFWSGLLGGLGGAWLGNEMFGNQGGMLGGGAVGGGVAGTEPAPPPDAGGWQADPGQIDPSGGGGADWGGGGFGDLGGGGFGGGDMGGGGGGGSW